MTLKKFNFNNNIYYFKIKYEKLNLLFKNIKLTDKINLFIDLDNMLKYLKRSLIKDVSENKIKIISSIFNICSFYKKYFNKKNINLIIYLVLSSNTIYLNYNKIFEILNIIVKYFNKIYFIKINYKIDLFIYNIHLNNKIKSIVLTKNKKLFLLSSINRYIYILRPKKNIYKINNSFIVFKNVVLYYYFNELMINPNNIIFFKKISPELLSLILTIKNVSSIKKINIREDYYKKSIKNIKTILKFIIFLIENKKISNKYTSDIRYIFNHLEKNDITRKDLITIEETFKNIDLIYRYNLFKNDPKIKDISWKIDLINNEKLHQINSKYFIEYPLDIDILIN